PPGDQGASEGTPQPFDLGSFSDPGADGPWAVDVHWGDGSPDSTFNAGSPGTLGRLDHTFADNGTYAVTVTVTDGHGDAGTASFRALVANVAPTLTAPADQASNEGATTAFDLGSFADPGPDAPWAVEVDWGDGTAHATFN